MDGEQWVADFVRGGGFSHFCEAILSRGLFVGGEPENMVDVQQACLVSCVVGARLDVRALRLAGRIVFSAVFSSLLSPFPVRPALFLSPSLPVFMANTHHTLAPTRPHPTPHAPLTQALILKVVRIFLLGVLSVSPHPPNGARPAAAPTAPRAAATPVDAPPAASQETDSCPDADEPPPPPYSASLAGEGAAAAAAVGAPYGDPEGGAGRSPGSLPPPLEGGEQASSDGEESRGGGGGVGAPPPASAAGSLLCDSGGGTLWARLPEDVKDAVLGAVEVPELQVRELRFGTSLGEWSVLRRSVFCSGSWNCCLCRFASCKAAILCCGDCARL